MDGFLIMWVSRLAFGVIILEKKKRILVFKEKVRMDGKLR